MSKEAITKVVQRAISDAAFRRQLGTDPTGALRGFDLTADEASALRAGDAGRLSALGVDQRMSKAFALGGASLAATRQAGTDLGASGLSGAPNSGLSGTPNSFNEGANSGVSSSMNAGGANSGLSSGLSSGPNSGLSGMPNSFNDGGASGFSSADATGAGGSYGNALVSGTDANAALVDDGASGIRTIIPTEPGGNLTADADDSSEAYLTKIGYDSGAAANADATGGVARASVIHDDPNGFLAANADATGGSAAGGTAFIDDSETYLTKVGYDPEAASSADAHEATWSGDDIAGPSSMPDDSPPAATDDGQLTP